MAFRHHDSDEEQNAHHRGQAQRPAVITSAASAPMSAKGRVVTMTTGFLRDPRLATMTKYTRTTPTAIEMKMAWNPLGDVCEYPAAGDGYTRGKRQRDDLLVDQPADLLRVLGNYVACDGGRAKAVRPANGHRPFLYDHFGQLAERGRAERPRNDQALHRSNPVGRPTVAGKHHVGDRIVDGNSCDRLADEVLAQLQADLPRAQADTRRLRGVDLNGRLVARLRHVALDVDDLVELADRGRQFLGYCDDIVVIRSRDADFDTRCWRAASYLSDPDGPPAPCPVPL